MLHANFIFMFHIQLSNFTHKNALKTDQWPNPRVKIIKLLEENIGVNTHEFEFGSGFGDLTPKCEQEIGNLDFTKI